MPGPKDLQCACATARQVARVLTQLYDSRLAASGIEAPQFSLLMMLEFKGPSSQVELGRANAMDKTTISRNLKLLERKGWVRTSTGLDRRVRQLTLTAAGRKVLIAALPRWQKVQNQLSRQMADPAWDALFDAFQAVTRAAAILQGAVAVEAGGPAA